MKTRFLFAIILCLLTASRNSVHAQPQGAVSFEVFYNELSPYGAWVDDPNYGYVWIPDAEADFRPYYSNGYWIMTDYGNTWVSNYPWGWGPFHYGRWTFDSYYGWIWIPDYVWGPAWVAWRWNSGYYGWAPLSPGVVVGVSFTTYYCPVNWWVFIPPHYIHNHHFHSYVYGPRRTRQIVNQTTIINNTYLDKTNNTRYLTGPRRDEISKTTGRDVNVYRVENAQRPAQTSVEGATARMYRPQIEKTDRAIAPPRATKAPRAIGQPENANTRTDRPFRTEPAVREPVIRQSPTRNEPAERRQDIPRQERAPQPRQERAPTPTRPEQPRQLPERSTQPQRTEPRRIERTPAERSAPANPPRPAQQSQPARTIPQRPAKPPVR